MIMRRYIALLCVTLLAACASTSQKPTVPAAASAPTQSLADDNLNAVAWTQTAVEHDLILREIYRVAREKLDAAVADMS